MKTLTLLAALLALPSLACAGSIADAQVPAVSSSATDSSAEATEGFNQEHTLFDTLLRKHVKEGWLDYLGMLEDRNQLEEYIGELQRVEPFLFKTWSSDEQFAFWINTYNAHVILLVIDNYPVESIKDLGGALFGKVWDKEFIKLNAFHPDGDDDMLSLNDIEHGILRPTFGDARVHAAINCASYSCPVLMAGAFTPHELENQLDRQMRAFINDPLRNQIDPAKDEVRISEIFKWFEEDFVNDKGSVREYLQEYLEPEAAKLLEDAELRYLDYDWSLNDLASNRK